MMKAKLTCKMAILMISFLLVLFSCTEERKEFSEPPWLEGTSIEVLTKKGNYNSFLRLMEKANYKDAITKQLYTIFVPDDAAFTKFFATSDSLYGRNVDSVGDLTKDEAVELFALHMMTEPRNTYFLIYENLWNELQTPTTEYNSLFFRKPTPSEPARFTEIVRYDPSLKGQQVLIKPKVRYMPLFSKTYFQDYAGAPDGSDYTFMYPNSKWGGLIQWHNAMIIPDPTDPTTLEKLANRTSTGFIYFLDQVCEPSPSIAQFLSKQEKYSKFYDLMERFAKYGTPTTDPRDKKKIYPKTYGDLIANLGEHQGPSSGDENIRLDMFTLFAPSNQLLDDYLNKTFLTTYPSIDSIPMLSLSYVVNTQIALNLSLKSKILKSYFNYYGDKTVINESDLKSGYMCDNGVVYEMNRILEPNVFSCVPGNLFFNSNYTTFLYFLYKTKMLSALSNPDVDVTLFAATNEEMGKFNIRYITKDNVPIIQLRGATNGTWYEYLVDDNNVINIAKDHIYYGKLDDLSSNGFIEMSSGTYVYYSNNTITAGGNAKLGETSKIVEKKVNDRNGLLYYMSTPIKSNYRMGQFIHDNPDLSEFGKLMLSVKLYDTTATESLTKDRIRDVIFVSAKDVSYWTAFMPTNAALATAKAQGKVPTDKDSLKNFILNHFVRAKTIFDDGKVSGKVSTARTEINEYGLQVYSPVNIVNSSGNLKVIDHSGQEIPIEHSKANNLVRKGVVHKISTVFKY